MRQEIPKGVRHHAQSLEGLEHVQILETVPGHTKIAWDIRPSVLNLYGSPHGGLILTLCDMAAGMAAYACGVSNVTQQGCTHLIKDVNSEKLCIQADTVYKGSRTVIHHVGITTPEKKVVADTTFTMFLFDPV